MKLPCFLLLLLALVSCKSVDPSLYTLHRDSVAYTLHQSVDTIVQRDTLYRHDSVIYRERTIHDTVYITKEVYRDRLEARGERQKAVKTDTVIVTEWRERVVEKPPERYIPRFYKISTAILYILIALIIVFIVIKIRLRCV